MSYRLPVWATTAVHLVCISRAPPVSLTIAIRPASDRNGDSAGGYLRKLALVASIFTLSAILARAQQFDFALSGSTLLASSLPSDLITLNPPVLKGGTFVGINADYVGSRNAGSASTSKLPGDTRRLATRSMANPTAPSLRTLTRCFNRAWAS